MLPRSETQELTDSDRQIHEAESDKEDEAALERGQASFYAIGVASFAAIFLYCFQFGAEGLSKKQETWGQFGDFLGGLLNPAIGLATIYLVLTNVRMQRKELRNSLLELRNSNNALARQIKASEFQNYRETFFTWLNSYQAIVGSVIYADSDNGKRVGRDGLFAAYREYLGNDAVSRTVVASGLPAGEKFRKFRETGYIEEDYGDAVEAGIMKQWDKIYEYTSHHIASMFRTLYRLIRWIDEQPDNIIRKEQKWQFISIARAQISDVELNYLFFNGLTIKGQNFVSLVNKYALFDNLDVDSDYLLSFMRDRPGCPYKAEAYSSETARATLSSSTSSPQ